MDFFNEKIRNYIASNLDLDNQFKYEKFMVGRSNITFKIFDNRNSYVLRRPPFGDKLESAHNMQREYRIISELSENNLKVPKPIFLCTDRTVSDDDFYIMEYCDGVIYWDPVASEVNTERRKGIFDQLNFGISALHAENYKELGLADFGKEGNYIERQISRWSKQYFDSETDVIDSMHKLIDWLPSKTPKQKYTTIVHGDYRLDNVVMTSDDKNMAMLDWELSTIGDPLADFGYHCLLWHIGNIDDDAAKKLGIHTEKEYLDLYLKRTKMELDSEWDFYIIFSLFKVAGICQGILGRVRDGTAASEFAIQMGKRAKMFADLGWEKAKKIS